jgi:hypothetical protein
MCDQAEAGDVKAAKLILDKVLSNAGESKDEGGSQGGTFVFQVRNLTLKHPDDNVIDVTPEGVSENVNRS